MEIQSGTLKAYDKAWLCIGDTHPDALSNAFSVLAVLINAFRGCAARPQAIVLNRFAVRLLPSPSAYFSFGPTNHCSEPLPRESSLVNSIAATKPLPNVNAPPPTNCDSARLKSGS